MSRWPSWAPRPNEPVGGGGGGGGVRTSTSTFKQQTKNAYKQTFSSEHPTGISRLRQTLYRTNSLHNITGLDVYIHVKNKTLDSYIHFTKLRSAGFLHTLYKNSLRNRSGFLHPCITALDLYIQQFWIITFNTQASGDVGRLWCVQTYTVTPTVNLKVSDVQVGRLAGRPAGWLA